MSQARLEQENGDLRSILKQYLDGILVNNQVLSGPNPLMIVNERSNIQAQPPAVAATRPSNVIEGNVAVNQQYYPAAPLGWKPGLVYVTSDLHIVLYNYTHVIHISLSGQVIIEMLYAEGRHRFQKVHG